MHLLLVVQYSANWRESGLSLKSNLQSNKSAYWWDLHFAKFNKMCKFIVFLFQNMEVL